MFEPTCTPWLLRTACLQEQVECLLCCFMLEDLRRFQAWDSGATRPYTGGWVLWEGRLRRRGVRLSSGGRDTALQRWASTASTVRLPVCACATLCGCWYRGL